MQYKLEIVERDGRFGGIKVNGEWHLVGLDVIYKQAQCSWLFNLHIDHKEAGKWHSPEYSDAIDINLEFLSGMVRNLERAMNGPIR